MNTILSRGALFAALVLAASACRCDTQTQQRNPSIEERESSVDFGHVQLAIEHTHTLVIYNAGADSLNISELDVSNGVFGVVEEAPLSVGVGEELELTLTFTPTAKDKRETGTLRISSDDPERPVVRINLSGTGVQAVATATPNPIAFGDVWVGENKSVTVTVRNGGTNTLTVIGAEFTAETPDAVSGDLSPLRQDIPAGGEAKATVRFEPTAMSESVPGAIRMELLQEQGGELVIPFSGRGVRAVPRLCFQLEGTGFETCTDPNAQAGTGNSLNVALPPICDSLVSPPDAGFDPCKGSPYQLKGQVYVKNEGNAPVSYSMQYRAAVDKACDGGVPARPDFQFSNAPMPSAIQWMVPTTTLGPTSETAPVETVYTATAHCVDEASDQAQLIWTRQGDTRQPNVLLATLQGQSKLPHAVDSPITITTTPIPSSPNDFKPANHGNAEYLVTNVELRWLVAPTPAGSCASIDGGSPFASCNGFETDPQSWCSLFAWAPGENPNAKPEEERIIPVGTGGAAGSRSIGQIVYGPHAGSPPPNQQAVCVYAVVHTTDPFHPQIISKIQGRHAP